MTTTNPKEQSLMAFLTFMSSTAGRATRVIAGLALIIIGLVLGGVGYVLVVVGLVPLLAGAFDVCVFAPLARMPFAGKAFREAAGEQ
jgi:Inner membrane protein YgaP-like, transmembrane domain